MRSSKRGAVALAMMAAVVLSGAAYGADPAGGGDIVTIPKAEYEAMKKDNEALKKDVAEMRKEFDEFRKQRTGGGAVGTGAGENKEVAELRAEVASLRKTQEERNKEAEEYTDEIMRVVKEVKERAAADSSGSTKLLITGDAAVGFDAHKHADSTFNAGVAPRFLWKLNDQMFFDAALDIGLADDGSTEVEMTIATFNYVVCDYLTIGGGLFVVPFAAYHHNFDPPWINPLPDDPLVFSDGGLAPGSALGIFATGGYRFDNGMKVNYSAWVDNGPELDGSTGAISFTSGADINNNKAVGGRLGFLPVPEFEVGYSFECGQASANGEEHANAFLQAIDANYSREFTWLSGRVRARGEWVWSHVSHTTIDAGAVNGGPFNFGNDRNGGYLLISYRPTLASIKVLRNFEIAERYDRMDAPNGAPGTAHEQRWTTGLDYWLDSRAVLKFAYQCDEIPFTSGSNAYMVQLGLGF